MTWHEVDWGGALPTPRPSELRWSDIASIVPLDATDIDVIVIDGTGASVTTTVRIGCRWAGRGWSRMLQCPRCSRPAGVLGLHRGELLCRRCHPQSSRRHLEHRSRRWNEFDAKLEDELLRALEKPASCISNRTTRMAEELLARDAARVDALVRETGSFLAAVDAVLLAQQLGGIDEE